MTEPKIVTLDIERQSAIVGSVWQLKQYGYIRPNQIIVPVRTICFAWKWWGDDKVNFSSEWDPENDGNVCKPTPYRDTGLLEVYPGHEAMINKARQVLSDADFVVGWNSKQYDVGNLRSHMAEYDMKPPAPHIDIDLIKTSRSQFGFMSHTLEEACAHFNLGGKLPHETGLWDKLRWLPYNDPDGEELMTTRSIMQEYNKMDVVRTEQMFTKMSPWIPRLNLYVNQDISADMDADMVCRKCNSRNIIWQGYRRASTRLYRRFQCADCGSWGQSVHSEYGMETASA